MGMCEYMILEFSTSFLTQTRLSVGEKLKFMRKSSFCKIKIKQATDSVFVGVV